ncbi:MAG TPA: Co2+/Mg2+ efflux protein ApaG [Bacteroidia bacterium]|nr:Co2+/Mg2+ efflux protein ApaG [Bacteroidia bacterium]
MVKISTHNIDVSVEVKYWPNRSLPNENHYFFVYFVTIENNCEFTVQLTKRHWDIFDSTGETRVVDGEGVVGETPVLKPGEKFQYNSGCNLNSDMGFMEGYYILVNLRDGVEFNVSIPRFHLIVPAKLN